MTDRWVIALALATAAGAYVASPVVPFAVAVVAACIALVATRPGRAPVLLVASLALLASVLGARSWAGLDAATVFPTPLVRGWATLVTDPGDAPGGGVQVDVRLRGKRLRAAARSPALASSLRARLAGEQMHITGEVRDLTAEQRHRLAGRHIAARLTLLTVDGWRPGTHLSRLANAVRRTIVTGAASLPTDRRALYAGVVLGDDREQDVAEVEDFRASGLTHLLAVSGQNVAFVLALARPVLRRLGGRSRLAAAAGALVVFGAVTRWEPSVLRAVAMALLGVWAATKGRPATGARLLALAVIVLVLVDPLLVRSVGFLLSVGASAGIALLAPVLERALPSPLAVTLAAQAGVAPVLLPTFGALPLVAIPANLLAVPAAGPLMTWGIAAGLPAGVVGGGVAHALHLPTHALLWWTATIARLGAALPLGRLTVTSALAVGVVAGTAWLLAAGRGAARWRGDLPPPRSTVTPAAAAAAAALVVVAVAPVVPDVPVVSVVTGTGTGTGTGAAYGSPLANGDRLWRAGGHAVVVADGRGPPGALLAALREARLLRLDVLVVTGRSAAAGEAVGAVVTRLPVRLVLAPADRRYGAGRTPTVGLRPGVRVRAGPFSVVVREPRVGKRGRRAASPAVEVQVASPRAPRARSP